jgi:glycine amidinotransferase
MYSVYQHWDRLRVCVVGRSYPPGFYSWVAHAPTRQLLERIAYETEEDYQKIITVLESFGVKVLRPSCLDVFPGHSASSRIPPPPMNPRDQFVMIGETLYRSHDTPWEIFYANVRDDSWPSRSQDISDLAPDQQRECIEQFHWGQDALCQVYNYQEIIEHVRAQGNLIKRSPLDIVSGAMVSRIGRDLYFGTETYEQDPHNIKPIIQTEFPNHRTHVINTGGHGDSTYCPVCPGLIVSLKDVPTYADTFPDWEVVYLPNQSYLSELRSFLDLKSKNQGRWWIPDAPIDDMFIDTVATWMNDWVGYVEETVFDVNMLIIDPKNVIVFNENDQVFAALARYGITPHVVLFRHRYFWDGGIHCVTLDLHRDGTMQDFFPGRS